MHEQVKDYYGKTLQNSEDLQTNACCTDTAMPDYLKAVLSSIHDEVMARYYGCGLIAPQLLKGMRILDLGCGSGRDCYALSALVGEQGYVVGVDMTDEQLHIANQYVDYHTERFGYDQPNVRFVKGYIEKLDQLDQCKASSPPHIIGGASHLPIRQVEGCGEGCEADSQDWAPRIEAERNAGSQPIRERHVEPTTHGVADGYGAEISPAVERRGQAEFRETVGAGVHRHAAVGFDDDKLAGSAATTGVGL